MIYLVKRNDNRYLIAGKEQDHWVYWPHDATWFITQRHAENAAERNPGAFVLHLGPEDTKS
jgi:hypothetical protein